MSLILRDITISPGGERTYPIRENLKHNSPAKYAPVFHRPIHTHARNQEARTPSRAVRRKSKSSPRSPSKRDNNNVLTLVSMWAINGLRSSQSPLSSNLYHHKQKGWKLMDIQILKTIMTKPMLPNFPHSGMKS